jgi:hypothetical protein
VSDSSPEFPLQEIAERWFGWAIRFVVAIWVGTMLLVAIRLLSCPAPVHVPDTIEYRFLEIERKRWAEKSRILEAELKQLKRSRIAEATDD